MGEIFLKKILQKANSTQRDQNIQLLALSRRELDIYLLCISPGHWQINTDECQIFWASHFFEKRLLNGYSIGWNVKATFKMKLTICCSLNYCLFLLLSYKILLASELHMCLSSSVAP